MIKNIDTTSHRSQFVFCKKHKINSKPGIYKIFNIDGTELITVHTNKMTKIYRTQTISILQLQCQ